MNKLDTAKRAQILGMLCKGMSMRGISRLADVSINTGRSCWSRFHDETVRNVRVRWRRVDVDCAR